MRQPAVLPVFGACVLKVLPEPQDMHALTERCFRTLMVMGSISATVNAQGVKPLPRLSAPVYYKDMMLVVVTDTGVAAIQFTDQLKIEKDKAICEGVKYRYRFLLKGRTKELTGTGEVYEVRDAETGEYRDEASELFVQAAGVRLQWSMGGPAKGWIYYVPEKMKVHLANSSGFERKKSGAGIKTAELDLSRFLPKAEPLEVAHERD